MYNYDEYGYDENTDHSTAKFSLQNGKEKPNYDRPTNRNENTETFALNANVGYGANSHYPEAGNVDTALPVTDKLDDVVNPSRFLCIITFFAGFAGFLFGYDIGVMSGATMLLRKEFKLSTGWQELIVSSSTGLSICDSLGTAALFALVGGFLNNQFGRRPIIILSSLVYVGGAICMGSCLNKYTLLLGRVFVGAAIGIEFCTVPMYLAEISPSQIRGRVVSFNVVMIGAGQFFGNVIEAIFTPHPKTGWRFMLGLGSIPAAIQFCGTLMMIESPRWLITKQRDAEARRVLEKLLGSSSEAVDLQFSAIKQNCEDTKEAEESRGGHGSGFILLRMIQSPSVRRALIVGCGLQMFQQLAGINTVMYYNAMIIRMSGISSTVASGWIQALTSAVNCLFTIVGVYLVEKIGRRPLLIGSLIGAILSLMWLAMGFQLAANHSPPLLVKEYPSTRCASYSRCNECLMDLGCGYCYMDSKWGAVNGSCLPTDYDWPVQSFKGRCNSTDSSPYIWAYEYCPTMYAWMALFGLVLYLICFAPGMSPMPWTINSEIYPLWARSTGNATATFTNWLFSLIMSVSFLTMTQNLTRHGTFWMFAVFAFLGLIFVFFLVPETKGRRLEDAESLFCVPWIRDGKLLSSVRKGQTPQTETDYLHIRPNTRPDIDSSPE